MKKREKCKARNNRDKDQKMTKLIEQRIDMKKLRRKWKAKERLMKNTAEQNNKIEQRNMEKLTTRMETRDNFRRKGREKIRKDRREKLEHANNKIGEKKR